MVKTSEMLATDNGNGRLLRSGLVAHMLDAREHEVTWWMSTFDHANRRNRAQRDMTVPFGQRGTIRMLYSPGYRSSISVARLRDHRYWGRAFAAATARAPPPDVIFCAYPTIESAAVCAEFGRVHQVPVVIDLRDMWPDIFAEVAPEFLRPVARLTLQPLRLRARAALRKASALFAITEPFLEWGLRLARRPRNRWDAAYYLAYPRPAAESTYADQGAAAAFWDKHAVGRAGEFYAVLVGSMTERRFDMDTVIAAARLLQQTGSAVTFILAGDGDDLPAYRERARDCRNVIFPGWLSADQIRELLARAHVGLVPYRNTPDYVMSVPNKVGEYLAASLPVVSSLSGALADLLVQRNCGVQVEAQNAAALAECLRDMQRDEPRRQLLAANARCAYLEELDAEHVYGRLVTRLEDIARARQHSEWPLQSPEHA